MADARIMRKDSIVIKGASEHNLKNVKKVLMSVTSGRLIGNECMAGAQVRMIQDLN